jgi:5-hydroxyisourate hydrolase
MSISTHVLDATAGGPASGVVVRLENVAGSAITETVTDADGRVAQLAPHVLGPGVYRLRFDTGGYFAAAGREAFYPEVVVTFRITDAAQHYHVPLLLSPFAYSTYRGS